MLTGRRAQSHEIGNGAVAELGMMGRLTRGGKDPARASGPLAAEVAQGGSYGYSNRGRVGQSGTTRPAEDTTDAGAPFRTGPTSPGLLFRVFLRVTAGEASQYEPQPVA